MTRASAFFLLATTLAFSIVRGIELDAIQQRGYLVCGTGETNRIFSLGNDTYDRSGFDAGLCKALAAGIFADYGEMGKERLQFRTVDSLSRWTMVQQGDVDVVAWITTKTEARIANYSLHFAPTTFHDSPGIVAKKGSTVENISDITDGVVCVALASTTADVMKEYFKNKPNVTVKADLEQAAALAEFLNNTGGCDYWADHRSSLASDIDPSQGKMLATPVLDREPLAPYVPANALKLSMVLDAVINGLILAEERGVTRNSTSSSSNNNSSNSDLYPDLVATKLGVPMGFAMRAVNAVGNYGELYDQFVESLIPRAGGLNRLFDHGGLFFPYD